MRGDNNSGSWTLKVFLLIAGFIIAGTGTGYAQYFSFGQNRVQYQNFKWKYIQSEHFDVYYYGDKNYELAVFSIKSLEASLKQLEEDLRHQITNRIRVIVYDSHNDFSQTNVVPLPVDAEGIGGVTDPWKNRITLPFMGDYGDFRRTLEHELVHAFMNDMFYGGSVQSIIQNNIQLQFPMWFSEGIAEYEALGWDTNSDMFIRDAVINNYLPPLSRLSGYYAYRGGQSLWNYIAEEYGRGKIGEIFQNIKTTRSVEIGFRQSLGLSIEELSKRWQDALKKQYFPEVAEREDLDDFATLVTERSKGGTYNTSPAISPQGDKIAMITNERGFMDVVVISAINGKKLKTLIKGEDNVNFEELNILNPNLTWSPDGQKIALSAKSKGSDGLAIVDYETGKVRKIEFPKLDAIGSVAWSPDGKKIAFDGNMGPYQDIYVYNLETQKFINVTSDVFSDKEPAWSADSKSLYFVSDRGDKVILNENKADYSQILNPDLYQSDIYRVRVGSNQATRLTKTPGWSEYQPVSTQNGQLVFISDQNGIPNVYEYNLNDRTMAPLTDLASGVMQMSVSADGSKLVVNAIDEGYLDIYLIKAPFTRKKDTELKPNDWAKRRARESEYKRVPATLYAIQMYGKDQNLEPRAAKVVAAQQQEEAEAKQKEQQAQANVDTTGSGKGNIDYRNYVFADTPENDSLIDMKSKHVFEPEANKTDDGRYQPKQYRLRFSPDITYSQGSLSTYGTYGLTQIVYSDLLGNHQISFGSDLTFDLRNSNYALTYGNLKGQTNYFVNFFHYSSSYQTIYGDLLRYRTYGGGVTFQRPLNKFERVELGANMIAVSRDFNSLYYNQTSNQSTSFFYPELSYTSDHTLAGFITPRAGTRYSLSLTGSPPITKGMLGFASLLGDWRHYINLGRGYTFAVRGSGAASFGGDSQTYFMGGMLGWINQKWARNDLPIDKLEDIFFTMPALPLRGYAYNTTFGDRFGLVNAEFRFPLFAAILPGPIPVLPLYNLQGVAFVDAGASWGLDVPYNLLNQASGQTFNQPYYTNKAQLDFKVARKEIVNVNPNTGLPAQPGEQSVQKEVLANDVLIGAGFGFRTILLGLPFRYDIGWPYYADGFGHHPVHYFTIGIDF